jgi:mono/diheme cytochrome c family protein
MTVRHVFPLGLLLLCCRPMAAGAEDAPLATSNPAASAEFFERRVRPILAERCFSCHGAKKQESSLRLDSRAGLLKGGDNGPVFDAEKPAASRLLKAIRYDDPELQMPPDGKKLPEREVAAIAQWIAEGAPWPVDAADAQADPTAAAKAHWAFNPFGRRPCPA